MHVGRTGGNDDGSESEFVDFLKDELLTGFAAHVFVVHGTVYAGHFGDFIGNFFAVHGTSDVFATPTSKNADFHISEPEARDNSNRAILPHMYQSRNLAIAI
jgi:hypothetical protein